MIQSHEQICPLCGLVLPSYAAWQVHWAQEHDWEKADVYRNGCPILDEEGKRG